MRSPRLGERWLMRDWQEKGVFAHSTPSEAKGYAVVAIEPPTSPMYGFSVRFIGAGQPRYNVNWPEDRGWFIAALPEVRNARV